MIPFLVILLFVAVQCSPLPETSLGQHSGDDEERHFANGTIIGKCTYLDKEGDPVHVKYYADKGGYGVELQSIKVSRPSQKLNQIATQTNFVDSLENIHEKRGPSIETRLHKKALEENEQGRKQLKKSIRDNGVSVISAERALKDYNIASMYSGIKEPDPDYEIFVANRLKHISDNFEKKKMPNHNKGRRLLRNAGWKCLHNND